MRILRGKQVVSSLTSQETQDVFADGTDLLLSSIADSDALEQIPVFGSALKLYRASKSVREELFLQRLAYFLEEASKLDEDERERFSEKLQDPDEADRFGETLITLIERAEDPDKPRIFGRLTAAFAKGHLDVSDLTRLCKMVNRAISEDFHYLKNMRGGDHQRRNEDIEQALYSAGFLKLSGMDGGMMDVSNSGGVEYTTTDYGDWLIKLGLSEGPVPEYVPVPNLFGLNG